VTYIKWLVLCVFALIIPHKLIWATEILTRLDMEQGDGSVVIDSSGLDNNGVLVGSPVYDSDTPDNSSRSLLLDRSGDRIDLGTLDIQGSALTLSTWFKAASFPGSRRDPQLISKTSGNPLHDYVFMLGTVRAGSETRLRARIRVDGVTRNLRADTGSDLSTDTWYHAAAIYDGFNFKLFLDGQEVGSIPLSGEVDQDPSLTVAIGSRTDGGNEFDGLIDDVRIYNGALSIEGLSQLLLGDSTPSAVADHYTATESIQLSVTSELGLLSNDTNNSDGPLSAQLVDNVSIGDLTLEADGSFVYTPQQNFTGLELFTYRVNNGTEFSSPANVFIEVRDASELPNTSNDSYTTPVDETLTVTGNGVLANDESFDGSPLTAVLGSAQVEHGSLNLNSDGSFSYTPDSDFLGTDRFTYSAVDVLGGVSNEANVEINVVSSPLVINDAFSLNEDTSLSVFTPGVLVNDQDSNLPENLFSELVEGAENGTLLFREDGSFEYEPDSDFFGTDSFTYKAIDSLTGFYDQGSVTLTIEPINDSPVAVDDSFTTDIGLPLQGNVLINDIDVDLDVLTTSVVEEPQFGSLSLDSNGNFEYAPNTSFASDDSFTYTASDVNTTSILAQVSISVVDNSLNNDPDLLVNLHLDDGSNPANDSSGNSHHGTLSGPTYVSETGDGSQQSLEFDGTDDVMLLGTIDVDGSGLTLSAWFNADGFTGSANDPRLISKASGTAANDHIFLLSTVKGGNEVRMRARVRINGRTFTLRADPGTGVDTGIWYHAAATYDGANLMLYLNGIVVGSIPLTGAVDKDENVAVAVGSQPNGNRPFDGKIDEILILQRALSANEIQQIAAGVVSPVANVDSYDVSEDETLLIDVSNGVLANDTGVSETALLLASLESEVSHGLLELSQDGSFSYTPNENFNGVDTFSYRASGDGAISSAVSVEIIIEPVNDAPLSIEDSFQGSTTANLTVVPPGVLENDLDIDSSLLLVETGSIQPEFGTVELSEDGSFVYIPDEEHPGTDQFTYVAVDSTGARSSEANVNISLVLQPIANDDDYNVDEDNSLTVTVSEILSNDVDPIPPFDLIASIETDANHGEVEFDASGSFTYLPYPNYFGEDSFSYRITDPISLGSSTANITINVTPVPDPPNTVMDIFQTDINTDLQGDLLINDTDPDSDSLEVILIQNTLNGELELDSSGQFAYTPNPEYSGFDNFTYVASDGELNSDETLVTIEIESQTISNPELLLHLEMDDQQNIVTDSSDFDNHGTLNGAEYTSLTGDGSAYALRFNGLNDNVSIGALDVNGDGLSLSAWIYADSFPGSSRDSRIISKARDTSSSGHFFMISSIAVGNEIRLRGRVKINGTTHTLIANSGNILDVERWYHVAAIYNGNTFELFQDGVQVASLSATGTVDRDSSVDVAIGSQPSGSKVWHGVIDDVRILQRPLQNSELIGISSGNNPPVAQNDEFTIAEDEILIVPVTQSILTNDSDLNNQTLTARIHTDPSNGTVQLSLDGSFQYTPDQNFTGIDFFEYQVSDSTDLSNVASVVLNVDPVNDVPEAVADLYQISPGQNLSVNTPGVLENDSDVDGDGLTTVPGLVVVNNGQLNFTGDGAFTYAPDEGFQGVDSFSYRAVDDVNSESEEVLVSINVVNPPAAIADSYVLSEDEILVVESPGLLGNDIDVSPPQDLVTQLVAAPENGVTQINDDGSFSYTPDSDYFGQDVFVYEVIDPVTAARSTAEVGLVVNGTDDPPVASPDEYVVAFETELQGNVLDNDTDPDGDDLNATLVEPTQNGTVQLSSNGQFTYMPTLEFDGVDSFTYLINDGISDSPVTSVIIAVQPFLPSDPLSLVHLPLDDGLNPATDFSGFGNHGDISGATYQSESGDDSISSLEFDGVDNRIELGFLDTGGSEITLAAWINADRFPGVSSDPRIISKASSLVTDDHIFSLGTVAAGSGVRLRARLKIGGRVFTIRANAGADLETGRWYHAAVTFDGQQATLYLDGIEVQVMDLDGEIDAAPFVPVTVGSHPGGGHEFDGLIDDVRILRRALDKDEIAFLAGDTAPNASFTVSSQVGEAPFTASFDATDTFAFEPENLIYTWDFGDGNFGAGETINHTYTNIGTFNATLTVTDSSGESGSTNRSIRISAPGNSLQVVNWSKISTSTGEIPSSVGFLGDQTAAVVFDINGDGVDDFVIGGRLGFGPGPSMEWWEWNGNGWNRHTLEPELLPLQVGGAPHDIDGDGDLDFVLGEDINGGRLYWWENPYPNFDQRWTRHEIIDLQLGARYHDQVFGDFDGDGRGELAFWNNSTRDLYLSEIPQNPKFGQWFPQIIFTAPSNAEGVAVADIDLDGVDDLLAAGYWFKHQGQGNYEDHIIDASRSLVRVQAGQLVAGGRPEVVYDSAEIATRLIMYQWIDDEWVGSELLAEDIQNGHSLNIGDVNNDGFLDVMSAEMFIGGNTNPESRIFYGDGAGNFFPQLVSAGIANHESKLADLDGDGDLDILGKPFREGSPEVNIWINDLGAIPLEWERFVVDATVPYRTIFVEHGDIDGDGFQDIATGAWWWRNPGVISETWDRFSFGEPLNQLASMYDFDGDGDLDAIGTQGIGSSSNSSLSWARNDGAGNFSIHSNITAATGDFLQGIAIEKFVDDKLEIILSWQNCVGGLQVLTVPPVEDISTAIWSLRVLDTECGGESLDAADIDQDGDLDLLTGYTWYRNEGEDQYSRFDLTGETPGQPDRNILADMDNDGDLDALIGFGHDNTRAFSWFAQGEDPTALWIEQPIGNFEIGTAQSVDVSDLDGDGFKDVVVGEHQFTNPPGLLLEIYRQQSDGSWVPQTVFSGDEHHDGTQLFDADNDGDLDIISIGWAHRRLLMYENRSLAIETPYDIPTSPGSLNGITLSDGVVNLTWTSAIDNIRVEGYQVYRDSVLLDTVTSLTYSDISAENNSVHEYQVIAVDGNGNLSESISISVNTVNVSEGIWWNTNWPYRTLLGVVASDFSRVDQVVEFDVNPDQLILDADGIGQFNANTLRCHEVDADGVIVKLDVDCQIIDDQLTMLVAGESAVGSERYFHLYMDIEDGLSTPNNNSPLIMITDNVEDQGQSSFQIDTQSASYFFHKAGAGFSSLLDNDGVDWIGYDDDVPGVLGEFRGIPNLVTPQNGGHFHPGATTATSILSTSGRVKSSVTSTTSDGEWETKWDFYPHYTTLTVLEAATSYWFLYEGTPGGFLDSGDFTVRSGDISTLLSGLDFWSGDLDEEWVYLSASEVNRSLFAINWTADDFIDSYRPAISSGGMTIFGFGRDNSASLIDVVPKRFTIGLVESKELDDIKLNIDSILYPMDIEISPVIPLQ